MPSKRCRVAGCPNPRHYNGLCRTHLNAGGLDAHLLQEPDDPPWCICLEPRWRHCGPFFPAVRECADCGKPDPAQLGQRLR